MSRYVRFARKHQVAGLEAEGWRISDDLGGTHHGEWSVIMEKDCGMTASEIATKAAEIMSGDRARTHGDKRKNHENIAALWNAFLAIRREPAAPLSGSDVALMVGLLKIARTQLGDTHEDDYLDGAAYLCIAGEIALSATDHAAESG